MPLTLNLCELNCSRNAPSPRLPASLVSLSGSTVGGTIRGFQMKLLGSNFDMALIVQLMDDFHDLINKNGEMYQTNKGLAFQMFVEMYKTNKGLTFQMFEEMYQTNKGLSFQMFVEMYQTNKGLAFQMFVEMYQINRRLAFLMFTNKGLTFQMFVEMYQTNKGLAFQMFVEMYQTNKGLTFQMFVEMYQTNKGLAFQMFVEMYQINKGLAFQMFVEMYQTNRGIAFHPRTSHWPLMSSPFPTLAICLSYVYLTKFAGPKLMENRKPFELRNVLIAYNLFQVIFSSWLFYECLMGGWWGQYSFQCQPVDNSNSPTAIRSVGWNVGKSACMSVGVGSGMSSSTCAISQLTTFFQHLDTRLGDHVTLNSSWTAGDD
uniref:Elongation of very long chain fatty acids protein n=1 Tax=Timema shepardi TaxID=629360 RepID=A0A7R9AKS1_TIMSH|nr:unnamed protein product [Timema shepardi]